MARFTRSSGYKSIDFMVNVPGLYCDDVTQNGRVMICNSDLFFIKTRNAGTNTVEIHRWSHKSKFQSHDFGTGTRFKSYEAGNGQYAVCWTEANWWHTAYTEGHSAFLTLFDNTSDRTRVRKTGGGEYEPNSFVIEQNSDGTERKVPYWEDFGSGNQRVPGVDTGFHKFDVDNGTFFMSGNHKLYVVKFRNVGGPLNPNNACEVHMTNRSNDEHKNFMGEFYHAVSRFGSNGATVGTFSLDLIA